MITETMINNIESRMKNLLLQECSLDVTTHPLTKVLLDVTTHPLTKVLLYYWKSIFYSLFILFISALSFLLFLYIASWRYKRDYLHASIDILFYIMVYTINTIKKQTLLYYFLTYDTKKVTIWTWFPQSTICGYAPVKEWVFTNSNAASFRVT